MDAQLPASTPEMAPAQRLRLFYICALTLIAGLTILAQVKIQHALHQQEADGPTINIAGRQRMLSQRLAKASVAIQGATNELNMRRHLEELRATAALWKRSHEGLQQGNPELGLPGANSDEVREGYQRIKPHYLAMLAAADEIIRRTKNSPFPDIDRGTLGEPIDAILRHEGPFLKGMNDIVFRYDAEATAKVSNLQQNELLLMLLTLAVLLAEALFIFEPAGRAINKQWATIRRLQSNRARELAQKEADQRVLRLAANVPGMFYQLKMQADGRATYPFVSDGIRDLYGLEPEDAYANPELLFDAIVDEDRPSFDAVVQASARSLEPFRWEGRLRATDGQIKWIKGGSRPGGWENGTLLWDGLLVDITELKQTQNELAEAQHAAEAANHAKSDFLATMSHEIRTPMNGVLGMVELLSNSDLNSVQRRFVDTIRRSGDALLCVINDVLDFSKIESGKLLLDTAPFEFRELIEDLGALLAPQAHEKGLELAYVLPPGAPLMLAGDAGRLRQVLINLIGNAIKFTEQGEVTVRVAIDAETDTDITLRVEVHDTGIGIAAEAQERVFESFSQADSTTSRRHGGTGLGLAVSKRLTEIMGGRIGVDSTPGSGSNFWLANRFDKADVADSKPPMASLTGVRALIVDDNATNREILGYQLDAWDVEHSSAATAAEALLLLQTEAARSTGFDLVLLDLNMPEICGLILAERLLAAADIPDPWVIILGSSLAPEDFAAAGAPGVHAHLRKPVRQSELEACIRRLIGQGQDAKGARGATDDPRDPEESTTRLTGRVLLVEDNLVNQEVASEQLRLLGLDVIVAHDGRQGVARAREHGVAAVLMDCQMPELDGYAATAAIRQEETETNRRRLPIIALTANAMASARERCLQAGMDDYISKPFNATQLADVLRCWLPADNPGENHDIKVVASGAADAAEQADADRHSPSATLDQKTLAVLHAMNRSRAGGFLSKLISVYRDSSSQVLGELRQAADREDTETMRRCAHTLKSSSANLAALRLSELCRRLETRLDNGGLANVAGLVEQIETEHRVVLVELDKQDSHGDDAESRRYA